VAFLESFFQIKIIKAAQACLVFLEKKMIRQARGRNVTATSFFPLPF